MAISFFVAGFAILIPFVVRVHKVNRQIMALFALIPGYSVKKKLFLLKLKFRLLSDLRRN